MCACGKKREQYEVVLSGGIKIKKPTEAAAKAFAARHPGATWKKL